MRVRTAGANSFTYPDVVITCGREEFLDGEADTLLNPLVIVEVLSGSTAEHDRTTKVGMYRQIESLREYLLVAQDSFRVEQYVRQTDDLWMYRVCESPQAIVRIESAGLEPSVEEVYAKVASGEEAG